MIRGRYYNPRTGYTSAVRLFKKLKLEDPSIRFKDVQDFLDRQYTYQVTRQHRRPKQYPSVVANFPRDSYQMDIMIYDRYEINNYKYVLACIDVYSRYVQAIPLTNMRETTLLAAIKELFGRMGAPDNLNCDQQFVTPASLRRYFTDVGVTVYASEPDELHKTQSSSDFFELLL